MTSAVLTSRDETAWPVHMGSVPFTNRHLNPYPNPIHKKKQKKFHAGNVVAGRFVGSGPGSGSGSPVVTQTASNDAYSFNQTSTSRNVPNYGEYLTFEISSFSKSELVELRKRLSGELQKIRDLRDRIESGRFSSTGNPRSSSKIVNRNPIYPAPNRAFSNGIGNGYLAAVNLGAMLKDCKQIMGKLLKHKFAFIFKAPVDVVGLGLHDYYSIVKCPMDLGTVRSNLTKNLYPSPVEFAADVRLTFNNALLYNPKNDDVYLMADQMLGRFEELFRPLQEKIDSFYSHQNESDYQEFRAYDEIQHRGDDGAKGSLWENNQNQSIVSPPGKVNSKSASPDKAPVPRMIERMHSTASTPSQQSYQPVQELPTFPLKDQREVGRGVMKQPKPKAKDVNKREMTMEEKQKLGIGLQSLPQEKIPQMVQIIQRNGLVAQDGDEIELDIEALDTETIWELDRLVTNWKKSMSKIRRQALMDNNGYNNAGVDPPSTPIPEADMGVLSDKNEDLVKFKDDDEDVDIDDDMPATTFPPVEIERDEGGVGTEGGVNCQDHVPGEMGNASSSSGSSSSDSSSSSGSDSGSSSDSDADDAQS